MLFAVAPFLLKDGERIIRVAFGVVVFKSMKRYAFSSRSGNSYWYMRMSVLLNIWLD